MGKVSFRTANLQTYNIRFSLDLIFRTLKLKFIAA